MGMLAAKKKHGGLSSTQVLANRKTSNQWGWKVGRLIDIAPLWRLQVQG
jgi:hypothetical protein